MFESLKRIFKGNISSNDLYIYNTLGRKKELFKPIKKGEVLFYHCGPTVYWTQHVGNMRAMVLADLIRRTFVYNGYKVRFVRNYTDVGHLTSDGDTGEDKMEKAAAREGLNPDAIADKYIKIFEDDIKDLNVLEADAKPRATQYIKEIIDSVQILLQKGFAYETDLAVYFDITKAKDYTRLSGQKVEDNKIGAGNADTEDPQKRNPQDFSVWFFKAGKHKNALQYWSSPFTSSLVQNGEGFPGWHIECSAMIRSLLGKTIDLHMGGAEHIPVHHTNEIAQSEAINGVPFVNYWLHNEWLLVNDGKMSKSQGTNYSVAEIKEKGYNPLSLRYFFLQANYRSKQNFTWEALTAAENGYKRLLQQIAALGNNAGNVSEKYKKEFTNKINDDFNFSQGLALISEILKSNLSKEDKRATILDFDRVLGLALGKDDTNKEIPDEIQHLLKERQAARENKDWEKADKIRNQIITLGFEVRDK
ncbi:MAG: cysteine--tRNA ligase [bacterium]